MASFTNTLGAQSRRGQWRFRRVLRSMRADGRIDTTDAGLVDFSNVSEMLLTVTPRDVRARWCWLWSGCGAQIPPVLSASLSAGTLTLSNPGIVEALFPAGTLLTIPAGLYDVRLLTTVGSETAEVFNEPIEFA